MAHNVYGLSLTGADYYLQSSRPSAPISSSSLLAPASGNTYFPSSNGGFFHNNGVNQGFGDVVMNKSGVSPAFQQPAWPHSFASALKRPHEQVSQGIMPSGNALTKRPRTDGMGGLPIFPQRPGQKDCKFYMTTRTCKFGDLCKFDHPVWVPAGGIPDWKEASSTTVAETLPERPGEPECTYYMKTGICKFGARCRFNHPSNRSKEDENDKVKEEFPAVEEGKGKEECGSELDNTDTVIKCEDKKEENKSECKDETEIKSSSKPENKVATFQPATVFNSKGLPVRPGESDCSFYIKMGSCKYGETCKFNHPDRKVNSPVAAVTLTPPSQSVMSLLVREHGHVRPSVTQQPGQHNFLLSQPSFASSPQMPGQANFTLPQRPGQPECPVFSQIGKCDFGAMCQFNHTTVKLTLAGLPRREGADICAYYLKTGICKYQAACRFDHPPPGEIEGGRFKPSVKLTPAGLPRREGEQFCDFYMKTGTCKFAANCRFDHPPPAEAAAKTSLKLPVPDNKAEEGLENGSVIISKEVNKDGGC